MILLRLSFKSLVGVGSKHFERNRIRALLAHHRTANVVLIIFVSFYLPRSVHLAHVVLLIVLLNCDGLSDGLSVLCVDRLSIGMLSDWSLEGGFFPGRKLRFDGCSDRKVMLMIRSSDIIESELAGHLYNGFSDAVLLCIIWVMRFNGPIGPV